MSREQPAAIPTPALEVVTRRVEQTIRFGLQFGTRLQRGDLVLLVGNLGVGKTQLVKGIVQGLGSTDLVTSPSFVLINEYRAGPQAPGMRIYHADLYRIDDPAELAGIGLDELWHGQDICLIEWAERAQDWLPAEHLTVQMSYSDSDEHCRVLRLYAHGSHYARLLDTLATMPLPDAEASS